MSETKVPALPAVTQHNIREFAHAIKQIMDVREGRIGDPLDANITFRDLIGAGIAEINPAFNLRGAASPVLPAVGVPTGYDPTTDLTPPPAPTGFSATSGLATAILQWDAVPSTYLNHSHTEVWRSTTNALGNAVMIGTSESRFYADAIGRTSQTFFYWVRHVSQADLRGAYNSTNGTSVSTGLVGGADLTDLIITADKLANSAVTSVKLSDGSVVASKIADAAVVGAKLANLAVEAAKLANSAVTAEKIANLAVGTAAIQDAAINSAKIASLAVGSAAIQNAAITNAKIADLAVDNAKIASLDAAKITTGFLSADRIEAGTIDAKIANISAAVITSGTIATARIGDASITGAKIADATIGFAKIANDVQSTNYVAGSAGWRINKTGNAEFQDATIRGVVRSTDGLFLIDTINKFISISV